jgi:hypothetical protein
MLFPDWTHANTIAYSADDGDVVLSLRNQSWIIKIDYANGVGKGDVVWRLGYQGDFSLRDSSSPADWFFAQHDTNFFRDQLSQQSRLAVFDNGNNRFPDFSRNICPSAADDVQYPWMALFGRRVPDCYSRPALFAADAQMAGRAAPVQPAQAARRLDDQRSAGALRADTQMAGRAARVQPAGPITGR